MSAPARVCRARKLARLKAEKKQRIQDYKVAEAEAILQGPSVRFRAAQMVADAMKHGAVIKPGTYVVGIDGGWEEVIVEG